jgi:hypothetical protein
MPCRFGLACADLLARASGIVVEHGRVKPLSGRLQMGGQRRQHAVASSISHGHLAERYGAPAQESGSPPVGSHHWVRIRRHAATPSHLDEGAGLVKLLVLGDRPSWLSDAQPTVLCGRDHTEARSREADVTVR